MGVACVVFSQMGEDNVLYLLPKNNELATKRQLYTLPPSVQGMGKSFFGYESNQLIYTEKVGIERAALLSEVRTSGLQTEGPGFESRSDHQAPKVG